MFELGGGGGVFLPAFGLFSRADLSSSVVAVEDLLVSETVAYHIHLLCQQRGTVYRSV